MRQTETDRPHTDPLTLLTQSMRRVASLSLDDITRGLENFANPTAKGLLESLGRTRQQQVDALASMLRNSSEEDVAEMGMIFGEAMAKLAEERSTGASTGHADPSRANGSPERPRCRRDFSSAEWRRERRRHS